MNQKHYYVYISTNNRRQTVLYIGITSKLLERARQHKEKQNEKSFTARYNVDKVIYFETYTDARTAIAREKQIKGWVRKKKMALIEKMNPEWKDLVKEFLK